MHVRVVSVTTGLDHHLDRALSAALNHDWTRSRSNCPDAPGARKIRLPATGLSTYDPIIMLSAFRLKSRISRWLTCAIKRSIHGHTEGMGHGAARRKLLNDAVWERLLATSG